MTPDLTTIFPNGVVVRERDGRELWRRHEPILAVTAQPTAPSPIVGEVLPSAPFVKGSDTSLAAAARQTPRKLRGDELRQIEMF